MAKVFLCCRSRDRLEKAAHALTGGCAVVLAVRRRSWMEKSTKKVLNPFFLLVYERHLG